MKKGRRLLQLDRETIRALTPDDLASAAGGNVESGCITNVAGCPGTSILRVCTTMDVIGGCTAPPTLGN